MRQPQCLIGFRSLHTCSCTRRRCCARAQARAGIWRPCFSPAAAAFFFFKVGASDCFRKNESDRESVLQLFCRVFITLRGSALIMHEHTVPSTSQHFTGGGGAKEPSCKVTKSYRCKVLPLNPCQVLIHYLKQPFIQTHTCLSADSFVHPLGVHKTYPLFFRFHRLLRRCRWAQSICINY